MLPSGARLAALPKDGELCPGYRAREQAKARAALLGAWDRFGDEFMPLGWR